MTEVVAQRRRPTRAGRRRAVELVLAAMLLASATGCSATGGGTADAVAAPSAPSAASAAETSPTADPGASSAAAAPSSLSAALTWPKGESSFALNVCMSIAAHTIQGGGDSTDGAWNIVFDANLLNPGDTGTLSVSQKSDMTVVYDARITDLSVSSDGSFTGSGEDAGKAQFTLTGTCDTSW